MKIPLNKKIEVAASKDESRYMLRSVAIDGEHMVATDGRILAAVRIVREKDEALPEGIAAETLARIRNTKREKLSRSARRRARSEFQADVPEVEIKADVDGPKQKDGAGKEFPARVVAADGVVYPTGWAEGVYPNWRQVVPKQEERKGVRTIRFNVELFVRACAAIGAKDVIMEIEEDRDGTEQPFVLASGRDKDGGFAILMPIRHVDCDKSPIRTI